jgi:hypothetical protein
MKQKREGEREMCMQVWLPIWNQLGKDHKRHLFGYRYNSCAGRWTKNEVERGRGERITYAGLIANSAETDGARATNNTCLGIVATCVLVAASIIYRAFFSLW